VTPTEDGLRSLIFGRRINSSLATVDSLIVYGCRAWVLQERNWHSYLPKDPSTVQTIRYFQLMCWFRWVLWCPPESRTLCYMCFPSFEDFFPFALMNLEPPPHPLLRFPGSCELSFLQQSPEMSFFWGIGDAPGYSLSVATSKIYDGRYSFSMVRTKPY